MRNGNLTPTPEWIECGIAAGQLAPAARVMRPLDVFDQYAGANALDALDAMRELSITSYAPAIASWSGLDVDSIARIELDADSRRVSGMHDTRVDIGVRAAFDGMSDVTGDDDYGYSVAWLDVGDIGDYGAIVREYADELPSGRDMVTADDYGMSLAAYLATWRDMSGCRYALAYLDVNGCRSLVGYHTHADMMRAYREHESAYLAWLDASGTDIDPD